MEKPEIDPEENLNDPSGQHSDNQEGNDNGSGNQDGQSPTEVLLDGGVKVSRETLDKWARETHKDAFEARENREKWQAENTRKAQENAEKLRKAELYDRMIAEQRYEPRRPAQDPKQAYIERKSKLFPDVDPRFFESQFDDIQEMAESKGRELVEPIYARTGEQFEREFLASHPKVIKGSPEYQEIASLMANGVDAEKAYRTVFFDSIIEEQTKARTEEAVKKRDEEALRKLKQTRQTSSASGTQPRSKSFDKHAWDVINRMKGA